MDEPVDFTDETQDAEGETTVGAVCESIETRMWLADAYFLRGAEGLAVECLREAWLEYVRFRDILNVYTQGEALGSRLVRALSRAGDSLASLALGAAPAAEKAPGAALLATAPEGTVIPSARRRSGLR